MEMKVWLVRAATFALVGTLTTSATAQKKKGAPKGAPKPAPAAPATTPAEPQKPPASTTPEKEEEGPFAPTGKTGKLREEAKPEPEEKPKAEKPVPPPPEKPGSAGLDTPYSVNRSPSSRRNSASPIRTNRTRSPTASGKNPAATSTITSGVRPIRFHPPGRGTG